MNLYYLHFNNYYNRIVKKFDTLAEYLTLPYYDNVLTASIAFNPNDGVQTKQVANVPVGNEFTYDYCILAEGNDIISRWFILDAKRNLNGQYSLSLKRDLFADSYEPVLDAPAFIEKATLDFNDPMIFNSEEMTFNQIKTSETLLKDNSNCPWIVGYLEKNTDVSNNSLSFKIPTPYTTREIFETDWQSLVSNVSASFGPIIVPTGSHNLNVRANLPSSNQVEIKIRETNVTTIIYSQGFWNTNLTCSNSELAGKFYQTYMQSLIDNANEYYGFRTSEQANNILEYNGKVIKDESTNKFYKVVIKQTRDVIDYNITTGSLFNNLHNITELNQYMSGSDSQSSSYNWHVICTRYDYTLSEISAQNISYSINHANINKLQDAPYIMFAIPYGAIKFNLPSETNPTIEISEEDGKSIAIAVAQDLSEQLKGAGSLYDIQLLPYCPFQNEIQDTGEIRFDINTYYQLIKNTDNNNNVGLICFAIQSKFEFNIPCEIQISNYKTESQCDMYRLCSPNWNGQFEFNAAKNGGVSSINVDCEYKPYQPYIHLNPNFGRLYGQDFNDARGLICSGDFSLTQVSDAWATYQRQNINYQKTFDRQIQNMEVNNSIQMTQAVTQAALGTVGGALGGFMAGGIGGAIAGGTASAIGGAMDVGLLAASQAEAIDYTKDQFGYSLGNIKALPDSLTKVSAFNNNNKIFPVIEYYTCTEQEKKALEDKMKYNGMTVMRIGTIREFLKSEKSYIKGKIIRLENFNEDFHYVNELANEFNKGVFI